MATATDLRDDARDDALGRSDTRLPVLDGLRSGVLFVMLAHFGNFDNPASGAWLQRGFLITAHLSYVALDVFFVLSGFLITRILLDTKGSPTFFRTFYLRRALRIFPLYYGVLIVYLLILPQFVDWPAADPAPSTGAAFSFWVYLQNIALLGVWGPIESNHLLQLGHLWSLAVEEQFYFVWPVVVLLLQPRGLKRACIGFVAVALVLRFSLNWETAGPLIIFYPLTRMDGLALGSLLAVLAREPEGLIRIGRWAKRLAPITFGVLLFVVFRIQEHGINSTPLFATVGMTASVYGSASLVVVSLLARHSSAWARLFSSRPLRYLGARSYGIYVLHAPVAYILSRSGLVTREWYHIAFSIPLAAELAYCATLMAISIAFGMLSWRYLERPILTWKDRLPYRPLVVHSVQPSAST